MPGTTGTPAAWTVFRASVLEPIVRMAYAEGPISLIFSFSHRSANSGFSARKPYPGWMASAPVLFATSMILSITRYDFRAGAGPMQYDSSA